MNAHYLVQVERLFAKDCQTQVHQIEEIYNLLFPKNPRLECINNNNIPSVGVQRTRTLPLPHVGREVVSKKP